MPVELIAAAPVIVYAVTVALALGHLLVVAVASARGLWRRPRSKDDE
jgi:hypothetical protein